MKAASAGNSTLEIIIALAIFTLVITSVIGVVFGNQTVSADGPVTSAALYKAKLSLEKARALAKQNFSGVLSSSSLDDLFTRSLAVTDVSQCRKHVASTVQWSTDPSRPEQISLASDLTDTSLGGDCSSVVSSKSWASLQTLGTIDLGPNSSATDLDERNKTVFFSVSAPSAAKPDLFIVDVADPLHPSIRSSMNTGPGLNAIDAAGSYAFAANSSTSQQLQIFDVSDLAHPVQVAAATLPLGGSTADGESVFYYQSRVYVGASYTVSTSAHEFHIYDVTNPAAPVNLGHVDVKRTVNSVFVQGHYAYLAVGSSSGDLKDLIIYDISNPAAITEVGYLNLPGGGGKSVYLIGTRLYMGCFKMSGKDDWYVIDVSNPAVPTILGSKKLGADINGIRVASQFAFLATSDSNKEFQVWNVANPASMTLISFLNFPQESVGLDFEDNTVYAGVRSNDPLRIITSN